MQISPMIVSLHMHSNVLAYIAHIIVPFGIAASPLAPLGEQANIAKSSRSHALAR
jgi:hypothetical protein